MRPLHTGVVNCAPHASYIHLGPLKMKYQQKEHPYIVESKDYISSREHYNPAHVI